MTTDALLLRTEGLSLRFGGIEALHEVSLSAGARQICGLVGPNGAGKTSLFNCVSGLYRPTQGSIKVDGREVRGLPPHRLVSLGVARTFQQPLLRLDASVLDNVLLGAHSRMRGGAVAYAFRRPAVRREERKLRESALALLERLGISHLARAVAGSLPFGGLKSVELARALLAQPRLLLLDEPASGLVREEVSALAELIVSIRDERGIGVLLVEHHMGLVSSVCDKVSVLVEGRKVAEGSPPEVQQDPVVVEAYLGAGA